MKMRYLLKLNGYKLSSLIILISFSLVACASYNFVFPKEETINDVYSKIIELDQIHNGTFRTEVIPKRVLRLERIDRYLVDLEELRDNLNSSRKNDTLTISKIRLVQGRMDMLEAQKALQIAANIGSKGLARSKINCYDLGDVRRASYYFNETAIKTNSALKHFDYVLSKNEEFREILGIDDDKI